MPITLQVLARSVGDSVPIVTVSPRYYDLKYTECCNFDPEGPFPANETVWFGRHDGRLGEYTSLIISFMNMSTKKAWFTLDRIV